MQRAIVSFYQDEEDHWVAKLSCHHPQHVRHDPPLISRPWVLSEQGRQDRIGELLQCKRCEQAEWPQGLEAYKSTPHFTHDTTPKGLLADHSTREGVWAQVHVTQGALSYVVGERVQRLIANGSPGIIVPTQLHHVAPEQGAEFFVQFFRARR